MVGPDHKMGDAPTPEQTRSWPLPPVDGRSLADLGDSASSLDPEDVFEGEIERHLREVR